MEYSLHFTEVLEAVDQLSPDEREFLRTSFGVAW